MSTDTAHKGFKYFLSKGKPISEWPISEEIKEVVAKNPVEGILDFEEDPNIIVDRFCVADENNGKLLEVTRSLLILTPAEN